MNPVTKGERVTDIKLNDAASVVPGACQQVDEVEPLSIAEEQQIAYAALERLMSRLDQGDRLVAVSTSMAIISALDGIRDLFFQVERVLEELEEDSDDAQLREDLAKVRAAQAPGPRIQNLEYQCKMLARSLMRVHRRSLPWRQRPDASYNDYPNLVGDAYPHTAGDLAAVREDAETVRWAIIHVACAVRDGDDTDPMVDAYEALAGTDDESAERSIIAAVAALFELLHARTPFPQFAETVEAVRAWAAALRTEAQVVVDCFG
ncbi:hypothetical protein [Streptomyces sp. NBC_01304]|uniref:hypothetical protein n=1 Tax=Streptomyces sp. NBC_01304 TaxID=2903818 RepID=UPI002E109C7A|nr:hypothetical protein OG430_48910 [Streptomyces sp. NBC_01304]